MFLKLSESKPQYDDFSGPFIPYVAQDYSFHIHSGSFSPPLRIEPVVCVSMSSTTNQGESGCEGRQECKATLTPKGFSNTLAISMKGVANSSDMSVSDASVKQVRFDLFQVLESGAESHFGTGSIPLAVLQFVDVGDGTGKKLKAKVAVTTLFDFDLDLELEYSWEKRKRKFKPIPPKVKSIPSLVLNFRSEDIKEELEFILTAVPNWKVRGGGRSGANRRWVHVGNDEFYLAIQDFAEGNGDKVEKAPTYTHIGYNHVGLVVQEELGEIRKRLLNKGYQEGITGEDSAFRERMYFYDPFKNEWEFIHYKTDNFSERNDYTGCVIDFDI